VYLVSGCLRELLAGDDVKYDFVKQRRGTRRSSVHIQIGHLASVKWTHEKKGRCTVRSDEVDKV